MPKGYHGEEGRQIHYRHWPAATERRGAIVLFPPAPNSGLFFETAAARMREHYDIYAVDYPGYGGSDRIDGKPTITGYAKALLPLLTSLQPVSIIGFHTGNLVMAELSILAPKLCGNMVMVDVPYFDAKTLEKYAAGLGPNRVPTDISASFEKSVTNGAKGSSHDRAFSLWVETWRSGGRRNDAFHAAFAYDVVGRFPQIAAHVTVVGTDSNLYDMSEKAAALIPKAGFEGCRQIKAPAFEHNNGIFGSFLLDKTL